MGGAEEIIGSALGAHRDYFCFRERISTKGSGRRGSRSYRDGVIGGWAQRLEAEPIVLSSNSRKAACC